MSEVTAYLGLGSNLGDREDPLAQVPLATWRRGRDYRLSPPSTRLNPGAMRSSRHFSTLVCGFRTSLSPPELLALAPGGGAQAGTRAHHSLRAKDNGRGYPALRRLGCVDTPDLQIPHPRIPERAFVLAPLAEIAPHVEHPTLKRPISALLADAPGRETVVKLGALSLGEIP